MRPSGRQNNELRQVTITRNYTKHAEGSVLIEMGDTKVLCTASVEERIHNSYVVKVKVGLRLNTVCFLALLALVWHVKQHVANKVVALKKFSV